MSPVSSTASIILRPSPLRPFYREGRPRAAESAVQRVREPDDGLAGPAAANRDFGGREASALRGLPASIPLAGASGNAGVPPAFHFRGLRPRAGGTPAFPETLVKTLKVAPNRPDTGERSRPRGVRSTFTPTLTPIYQKVTDNAHDSVEEGAWLAPRRFRPVYRPEVRGGGGGEIWPRIKTRRSRGRLLIMRRNHRGRISAFQSLLPPPPGTRLWRQDGLPRGRLHPSR